MQRCSPQTWGSKTSSGHTSPPAELPDKAPQNPAAPDPPPISCTTFKPNQWWQLQITSTLPFPPGLGTPQGFIPAPLCPSAPLGSEGLGGCRLCPFPTFSALVVLPISPVPPHPRAAPLPITPSASPVGLLTAVSFDLGALPVCVYFVLLFGALPVRVYFVLLLWCYFFRVLFIFKHSPAWVSWRKRYFILIKIPLLSLSSVLLQSIKGASLFLQSNVILNIAIRAF